MEKIRFVKVAAILTTPQVPRYDAGSVEAPTAIRAPRAQGLGPEAFGAGLGRGLQQVAGDTFQVLKQEKEKADVAAIADIKTKSAELTTRLLYDPERGALTKKGTAAFGSRETPGVLDSTLNDYDKEMKGYIDALPSDDQKEAANRLYNQDRLSVEKDLLRHVVAEKEAEYNATFKASVEATHNNVARYHLDPQRVQQEIRFGEGLILATAKNRGHSPEVTQELVQTWRSQAHQTVVEQMMLANPSLAQEYLEKNRDVLLPNAAAKLDMSLKPLVKEVEINTAVDEVFSTAPATATRAELVAQIQEKYKDKPWRAEAEAEIRRLHADREDAQKDLVEAAEAEVYAVIAKVKLDGGVPKKSDVPPELWAKLSKVAPEKVSEIADKIRAGQEHATDRQRAESDRKRTERERRETTATIESLTTWGMLKGNPDILRNTNLDKLLGAGKITKAHYQDLVGDQLAIRQGKGEHEAKLLSDKAAVDLVLSAAGIDDKKHPEKAAKFYDALNGRMKIFEAENGRKPKQEDVKSMARGLLGEVSRDVNFWPVDKAVRVFEADPKTVRVPTADRSVIVDVLKMNGAAQTEEAITQVYLEQPDIAQTVQKTVVPQEHRSQIVKVLKKNGKPVTENAIKLAYIRRQRLQESRNELGD